MDVVQACISSGSIGVLNRVIHSVEDSSDVVNSSLVKKRDKTWHGSWFLSAEKAV